jgi:hypothetical protein
MARNEQNSSKLKLIKNYSRFSMEQQKLQGLSTLATEHEIPETVDFNIVINKFADLKARKVIL